MPRLLASIWLLALVTGGTASCSGTSAPSGSDSGSTSGSSCADDKTAIPFTVGMHQQAVSGVTVAIESDPPVPGTNESVTWKLTVTDKSGAPVPSGTPVAMLCKMQGHSHGCVPTPPVKEIAPGQYEAKGIGFIMPGHWFVTFQVNGTDEIVFPLCIQ